MPRVALLGPSPVPEVMSLVGTTAWVWGQHFQSAADRLPFAPQSLGSFLVMASAADQRWAGMLSDVIPLLNESGELLVWIRQGAVLPWCRLGMPLCHSLGLRLMSAQWGRGHRLMPWRGHWQLWSPVGMTWTIQHWRMHTQRLIRPPVKRPVWVPSGAQGWVPSTRSGVTRLTE